MPFTHLHIGLVYNALQRSTSEVHKKSVPTLDLLPQMIADITTEHGLMVIAGDFNAPASDAQDSLSSENLSDIGLITSTHVVHDPWPKKY